MFVIGESYPLGTAKGGDYFTGAAQRDIVVDGVKRREKVLVTPLEIDFEGQLCLSESTVRHMAQLFGMFDHGQVAPVLRANDEFVERIKALSEQLVNAWNEIERLREGKALQTIYVAPDGAEFTSKKDLLQYLVKTKRGVFPQPPAAMTPEDAPMPEPKEVTAP